MHIVRTAFAMLGFFLPGTAAVAGDTAELNILGFTPDGGIFAFEEYGVQDGSGFPYANRYYIDVDGDSFVAGTPIRVRIDEEMPTPEAARAEARAQGEAIVPDAELAQNRGTTAGANPVTELSADPFRMAVNPRPVFPAIDDPLEFRLTEIPVPMPERCADLGGEIVGFRLVRIEPVPGGTTSLLNEDDSVPASRGCPLGYRIGAVQTFFPAGAAPAFAVLIAVRSFGFEGPDHNWMAVTGRF